MSKTSLLTVTHDPRGRYIPLFEELHNELGQLYEELYIAVSHESSDELIKKLNESRFKVKIIPKKGAAEARREAVKFGLSGNSEYFHYCDFDRFLTWGKSYLDELKSITKKIKKHDFLILGRTERALNTHPKSWIETEKISNLICSMELNQEVDITAGSCSFSRESASYISKYSKDKMTDSEWPMIIHRIANLLVSYTAVEGLEYHEETNGVDKEVRGSEEWLVRLKLANIISESAIKTGRN